MQKRRIGGVPALVIDKHARPGDQFDAVIHLDRTRAVEPLEPAAIWARDDEPPETYPSAL